MGEYFDQLPSDIQEQVKNITKTSGLEINDESYEIMAQAWIEKKDAFEEKISELGMEESESFSIEDESGGIFMTYSGSLVNVGPMVDGIRNVEYTSIGIRSDVPDSASNENSVLSRDINIDESLEFEVGPVKSTSPIFKIAVVNEDLSPEDEQEVLTNATLIIADEFADINKTIIAGE